MKQTIVDRIEIDREQNVSVRLVFELETEDEVIQQGVHRFVVKPGQDLIATIREVNDHLVAMKRKPVDDVSRIQRAIDTYWPQGENT